MDYFDLIDEKYDRVVSLIIGLIICGIIGGFFGIGYVSGNEGEQANILRHSCDTACVSLGSKMASQEGNLCVCEDLTTMRGEYRQLFLHGRQTTQMKGN